MKIKLVAVGTKMPAWVETAFKTYSQRLPRECQLELVEIPAAKRSGNRLVDQWTKKEGQLILKSIPSSDYVVALDAKGQTWSSEDLANRITQWQSMGTNVSLLVGGPDGLSADCLARADKRWSLSALTLPHPMVRTVLSEAIYRAWSITVNHPYHRE